MNACTEGINTTGGSGNVENLPNTADRVGCMKRDLEQKHNQLRKVLSKLDKTEDDGRALLNFTVGISK